MSGGVDPARRRAFGAQIMQQLGKSISSEAKVGDVAQANLHSALEDLAMGAQKGQGFFDRAVQIISQGNTKSGAYQGMRAVLEQLPSVKQAVQSQASALQEANIMKQAYTQWLAVEGPKLKSAPSRNILTLLTQILGNDPSQRTLMERMLAVVTHPAVEGMGEFVEMAAQLQGALDAVPQTPAQIAAPTVQDLDPRALAEANMTAQMLRGAPDQIARMSLAELDACIKKLGDSYPDLVRQLNNVKERALEGVAYHVERAVTRSGDDESAFINQLNKTDRRNPNKYLLNVADLRAYKQHLSGTSAEGSPERILAQRLADALPQVQAIRTEAREQENVFRAMEAQHGAKYEQARTYVVTEYRTRLDEGLAQLEKQGVDVRGMSQNPAAQWTAILRNDPTQRPFVVSMQKLLGDPDLEPAYGDTGRALKAALDSTAGAAPAPEVPLPEMDPEAGGALRALRAIMKPHGGISVENLKQHMTCSELESYIRLIPHEADTLIVGQLREALEQRRAPLTQMLTGVLSQAAIDQVLAGGMLPPEVAEPLRTTWTHTPQLADTLHTLPSVLPEYDRVLYDVLHGDMSDDRFMSLLRAEGAARGDRAEFRASIEALMSRAELEEYAEFLVTTFARTTAMYNLGLAIEEALVE